VSQFSRWPEQDFRDAIDIIVEARRRFTEGQLPKAKLELVERAYGFRATADGVLSSPQLRDSVNFQEVIRYDWVHTMLADGVLTNAAWRMIDALEQRGLASQNDIHHFLREKWVMPAHRRNQGRALWRIFDGQSATHNKNAETIKCAASELLTLYSLLRHFARCRAPRDERVAENLRCFELACNAVDILLLAKRGSIPMVEAGRRLRVALSDHTALSIRLHGADSVKPKTHWAFDIADQLEASTFVFDAFVIERLHLRIRAIADNVKTPGAGFERAVLSGVVNAHSRTASTSLAGAGLVGATAGMPGAPGAWLSDHVESSTGVKAAIGDVVSRGAYMGTVVACCMEDGDLFVVVDVFSKDVDLSQNAAVWSAAGVRQVWNATEISECVCWQIAATGQLTALWM